MSTAIFIEREETFCLHCFIFTVTRSNKSKSHILVFFGALTACFLYLSMRGTESVTTVCAQVHMCVYVSEFEHFWLLSQAADSALQYFWASIQGFPSLLPQHSLPCISFIILTHPRFPVHLIPHSELFPLIFKFNLLFQLCGSPCFLYYFNNASLLSLSSSGTDGRGTSSQWR